MSLSQLLIYAISVLFGVKTIRHMEALPHFCSNLKAHLTRPLAVFHCQRSPGAWNKTGLSWEQKDTSQRLGWSKGLMHMVPSLAQAVILGSCSQVINSKKKN